jgi:vacuolar-type H+-ATPase subunit I/STV1
MANAVRNADKKIIVEKSAVPAAFENIKKCIEEMRAQVQSVEEEYNGDCEALKKSMATALTALETYLAEEKTVAQLVEDLGRLVDAH